MCLAKTADPGPMRLETDTTEMGEDQSGDAGRAVGHGGGLRGGRWFATVVWLG